MAILLSLFNIEELLKFFSKFEGRLILLLILLLFLFKFNSNPLTVFLRSKLVLIDGVSLFFVVPLFSNFASLSFMEGASNIRALSEILLATLSFDDSLEFSSSVLPV